jgi:hypothetical protein
MPEPFTTTIVILTALEGLRRGKKGLDKIAQAKKLQEEADGRDRTSLFHLEGEQKETDKRAARYGEQQFSALETISRMKQVLKKMQLKVSDEERAILEKVDVTVTELTQCRSQSVTLNEAAGAVFKMSLAASAAYLGTTGAVTSYCAASTGTAISSLSGAAAWNATLAWLGGGSLAAGGGGMTVGSVVLGGVVAAPILLIGGFVLSSKGEEALTQATAFDSQVSQEVYKRYAVCDLLSKVRVRINELSEVLHFVELRAKDAIARLENASGTPAEKTELFRQTMIFVVGVSEIINTPVLNQDESVSFNSASESVVAKYRKYVPDCDAKEAA